MAEETKNKTGLRSLELYYEPVMNREYNSPDFFRSQLRINDPSIGVLLPKDYLPVAQRSLQASKLALWAFDAAAEDISRLRRRNVLVEAVSVYTPPRLLCDDAFPGQLADIVAKYGLSPGDICIELPDSVLLSSDAIPAMKAFSQAGYKLLLAQFGGDLCPTSRICGMPLNFAVLDPSVTAMLFSDDVQKIALAQSLVELVVAQEIQPLFVNINKPEDEKRLPDSCIYFSGRIAGKLKKAASIRS